MLGVCLEKVSESLWQNRLTEPRFFLMHIGTTHTYFRAFFPGLPVSPVGIVRKYEAEGADKSNSELTSVSLGDADGADTGEKKGGRSN